MDFCKNLYSQKLPTVWYLHIKWPTYDSLCVFPQLCGRTIRVDHVTEYRRPKDEQGNEIIEKGCAPKTPTPSPTPSPSPERSPPPDKKKKKKKQKEKKKKKKGKKSLRSESPAVSSLESGSEDDHRKNASSTDCITRDPKREGRSKSPLVHSNTPSNSEDKDQDNDHRKHERDITEKDGQMRSRYRDSSPRGGSRSHRDVREGKDRPKSSRWDKRERPAERTYEHREQMREKRGRDRSRSPLGGRHSPSPTSTSPTKGRSGGSRHSDRDRDSERDSGSHRSWERYYRDESYRDRDERGRRRRFEGYRSQSRSRSRSREKEQGRHSYKSHR